MNRPKLGSRFTGAPEVWANFRDGRLFVREAKYHGYLSPADGKRVTTPFFELRTFINEDFNFQRPEKELKARGFILIGRLS